MARSGPQPGVKLDQIRWDSVAKIAAGALLAVAIVTTAPSLLGSEEPAPLDPDVGLPQASIPSPPPPAPPPSRAKPPKKKPKPRKRPPKTRQKPTKKLEVAEAPTPSPASVVAAPLGAAEDFGFERP